MPDLALLETIIDDSIAALKAGNLNLLNDLSEKADAAMTREGSANATAAGRLRGKTLRNEALISAAIKGVKAARQRAKDLIGAGQFSTYDSTGHRNHVGQSSLSATRRV